MDMTGMVIGALPEVPEEIRGLIFDCDGTIVDTMPLHYRSWVDALRHYGRELSLDRFYSLAGVPTIRMVEMFDKEQAFGVPIDEVVHRKETIYEQLLPQAEAIRSVVAIIEANAGRRPMAVASGGTRHLCTLALSGLGLLDHFQALVTCDDVEHGKPAPDIFLEAARRLGVPPTQCLVYEDADLGMQAAQAAGMPAVDIRQWARPA